jgi:hypothetical protein
VKRFSDHVMRKNERMMIPERCSERVSSQTREA